jgi:hypothetical protein
VNPRLTAMAENLRSIFGKRFGVMDVELMDAYLYLAYSLGKTDGLDEALKVISVRPGRPD